MILAEEQAQRRSALRSLLAKPLLVADTDSETLVLVRRHLAELRQWLNRETGWRLVADSDTARLFKTVPVPSDASHPARGHNKEPFGRRRYVTLCLALSALARADTQTTLGSLADDVLTAAAEPELAAAGFTLTLDSRADRSDLVAVPPRAGPGDRRLVVEAVQPAGVVLLHGGGREDGGDDDAARPPEARQPEPSVLPEHAQHREPAVGVVERHALDDPVQCVSHDRIVPGRNGRGDASRHPIPRTRSGLTAPARARPG